MSLSTEQIDILDHTAHRAANGLYCGDSIAMQALVIAGLMGCQGNKAFCPDEYFYITPLGRKHLTEAQDEKAM